MSKSSASPVRIFFSVLALGGLLAVALAFPAQAQSCNAPAADVITTISVPGGPSAAIPARDGCTIFVSSNTGHGRSAQGHIAVLRRAGGRVTLVRDIPIPNQALIGGMALSQDGKILAAANYTGVVLLNVNRLLAGDGTPIVEAKDESGSRPAAGASNVAISPDGKLLFVADERMTSVTVYDLAQLRSGDTSAIGRIPVGEAPVGLAFSPDGSKLYATSEVALPGEAPATCPGFNGRNVRQGLLTVADVARAAGDPAASVLANAAGDCDFVRVAISKDGSRAFVTARRANSLLVFDTAKLVRDSDHALVARVAPGKAPVGVAVTRRYVVTADSNRLAPAGRKSEWLSVINPVNFKVIGNIPAGLFPRSLSVTADGKTLLVTNSNSNSLELVDLERLTPDYFAKVKPIKDADDAKQAKTQAALDQRIENHQPAPGAEAALRHIIESFVSGAPDYGAMAPAVSNYMHDARYKARIQKFGALQSIAFKSTNRNGVDEFEVTFELAKTDWGISLSPDGKAAVLGLDAVK